MKKTTERQTKKKEGKLLNLPVNIWEVLKTDSERCRRSVTKQIEAILIAYYELEDVELDATKVRAAKAASMANGRVIK